MPLTNEKGIRIIRKVIKKVFRIFGIFTTAYVNSKTCKIKLIVVYNRPKNNPITGKIRIIKIEYIHFTDRLVNIVLGKKCWKAKWMNKLAYGMQKKNSHSSIGNPQKARPEWYLWLKLQTPIRVKMMSQTIKNKAAMEIPDKTALHRLIKRIRLSKL